MANMRWVILILNIAIELVMLKVRKKGKIK